MAVEPEEVLPEDRLAATGARDGVVDDVPLGALFFTVMKSRFEKAPGTSGHRLWVGSHEPICAGLIAGAALVGISDILVKVFLA